jgi:hypothetical protein
VELLDLEEVEELEVIENLIQHVSGCYTASPFSYTCDFILSVKVISNYSWWRWRMATAAIMVHLQFFLL